MKKLTQKQTKAIKSIIRHINNHVPDSLFQLSYEMNTNVLTAISDIVLLQLNDMEAPEQLPRTNNDTVTKLWDSNTRFDSYAMLLSVQTILDATKSRENGKNDNTVTLPAPDNTLPSVIVNAYRVRDVLCAMNLNTVVSVKITVYYRRIPHTDNVLCAHSITIGTPAGRALIMCCRPRISNTEE